MDRNSKDCPIRVDCIPNEALGLPKGSSTLGMTLAPGVKDWNWDRDMRTDMQRLRDHWRTDVLVSLIENHEYELCELEGYAEEVEASGIAVEEFSIVDVDIPREEQVEEYADLVGRIVGFLREGRNTVVHCRGGSGRTGTVEFEDRETLEPVTDIVGGGPHRLEAGQWTDDTSMALCLAESLIECQKVNLTDQLERYVRWWRKGHLSSKGYCFDIGGTTSAALSNFERTGDPHSGSTESYTAGNGSIMRLTPVPLFFASHPAAAIERSAESSITTHGAKEAVDACRYLGALICGAVNGVSKDALLSDHFSPAGDGYWQEVDPLASKIAEIASGSFKRKAEDEIKTTPYVVHTLEAALWAFYSTDTFEEGALSAVNLGDDADTTGAVYGQLAGAFYGASSISEGWRDKLTFQEKIETFADDLCRLARTSKNP